jgi:hypothetical protein
MAPTIPKVKPSLRETNSRNAGSVASATLAKKRQKIVETEVYKRYRRYIDKIDTNTILLLSSIPCCWDDGTLLGYSPTLTFPCLWLGNITTIASDFLSGSRADEVFHMMVITI